MAKQIKDVTGTIKKIMGMKSNTHTAGRGPNIGKEFTIFSIGILLDDEAWYNIQASSEAKVLEMLTNSATPGQHFIEGQTVKMYLESSDAAGKYWKITSITQVIEPAQAETRTLAENYVPTETEPLKDGLPVGAIETAPKKDNMSGQGPKDMPSFVNPQLESEQETKIRLAQEQLNKSKPVQKQMNVPVKEAKPVIDYDTKEANKYGWGMAVNNAAIVFAA